MRPGVVKAGVGEKVNDGLLKAPSTLQSVVAAVIDCSAGAFVRAIKARAADRLTGHAIGQ